MKFRAYSGSMFGIHYNPLYLHWVWDSKYGGFPKLGVPFGGPYNKDYSICSHFEATTFM